MSRGLLLCEVGGARFAVAAAEVVAIEPAGAPGAEVQPAQAAFGGDGVARRLLVTGEGSRVGVDGVELEAEAGGLLGLPRPLAGLAGGSVRGFVEARGRLWPLLGLVPFEHYLRARARAPR